MEKRGIRTEIGELNRWIKTTNRLFRNVRATIAALMEWMQEVKEILKEPQEIYLVELLDKELTNRNKKADTFERGRRKAHQVNRTSFMEKCNYLKQHGVYTLTDFEKLLFSVNEKLTLRKAS